MSSYIIAGSSNKKATAESEYLANVLKTYYPNLDIRIVIKHPNDWEFYQNEVFRAYGFKVRSDPFVYKSDGGFIGDIEAFKKLIEKKFGLNISNIQNIDDTKANEVTAKRLFDRKTKEKKGKKTIEEKIDDKLVQLLKEGALNKIEGQYEEVIDQGVIFYRKKELKYHPLFEIELVKRPDRPPIKNEEDHFEPAVMVKKDYSEEMMAAYIEALGNLAKSSPKKGANQAQVVRDNFLFSQQTLNANSLEENLDTKRSGGKDDPENQKSDNTGMERIQEGSELNTNSLEEPINPENQMGSDMMEPHEEEDLKNKEIMIEDENENIQDIKCSTETLPEKIKMNDYIIKNLKDGYYLAVNPDPIMNGQTILFKGVKENDDIFLLDFSKTVRHRKNDPLPSGMRGSVQNLNKIVAKENERESSFISPEINIYEPLTGQDWDKIVFVINKSDSVAFLQILPHERKSPFRLSNSIVNMIPRKYVVNARLNEGFEFVRNKCASLPFESYIKGLGEEVQYQKKNRSRKFKRCRNFPFSHLIFTPTEPLMTSNLCDIFRDMISCLNEQEDINLAGVNLVLYKDFVLLSPIKAPVNEYGNFEIFLQPFALLGYIHIPILDPLWPDSSKAEKDTPDFKSVVNNPESILGLLKTTAGKVK